MSHRTGRRPFHHTGRASRGCEKVRSGCLVHFDSHSDLCDEVFGQKYNHGTPFRRALEENLIDASHSIQVGMRGSLYDPDEHKMAAELGMKLIPAHKVREMA